VRIRSFQTESFRLTAVYAGLFVFSTLILMMVIFAVVKDAFENDVVRASNDDLAAIQRAYIGGLPRGKALHEAKEMIDDRLLAADAADLFLLQSGSHKIAGNLPSMQMSVGERRFPYPVSLGGTAMAGHTVLGRGMFIDAHTYAFVGRDLQIATDAEREIIGAFALVLLASLIIATAGGMAVSRSFLHRVDAITATCRGIMAGRLSERVPVTNSRNELDQLAATINSMLDRIATLMDGLRRVSTDIAHDLRTPLAHLRYKLERARQDARSVQDYASAVNDAIADCDHLMEVFSALLRIAQLEAGVRRKGMAALDLSELVRKVAEFYEPLISDLGRPFSVRIAPNLTIMGDGQLLFRLLANLLDNAVRHTPDGTPIALEAEVQRSKVLVSVRDKGTGIPPEDRESVFRRFFRREQSRTTPGSGLGLALVSAIAELHGSKVTLEDNKPGLRASLEFERIAAPPVVRSAMAEAELVDS